MSYQQETVGLLFGTPYRAGQNFMSGFAENYSLIHLLNRHNVVTIYYIYSINSHVIIMLWQKVSTDRDNSWPAGEAHELCCL